MQPKEKPSSDEVNHKTGCYYQTINHNPFVVDSPSNRVCQWKRDFVVVFERNFSFTTELPNSKFSFIHQEQPIIEEANFDNEAHAASTDMAMEVYNSHHPSQEYVRFIETTLLKTREALAKALQNRVYVEREAKRWKILGEYLFKKCVDTFLDSSADDESRDEFFCMLEEKEEATKQKKEKK